MGIFCQINILPPIGGAYHSGELVTGMIKYALDEKTEFEKITVSLKGMGHLRITQRTNKKNRRNSYINREVYVDTDEVIQEGKLDVPVGSYEIKFSFRLPQNIPPSFQYYRCIPRYRVNCKIKYYVRIKFEQPGWFAFAKHFRKEISVASVIKPTLLTEPVIYGERSTLLQVFSRKTSIVIVKANIINSVIPIGGKIEVQYEVINETNIIIKSVETKLIEVYTFKTAGHKVKAYEDIPDSDSKTGSINCGDTRNLSIEINVPADKNSLENSNIVSRDYVVRIIAELPMPHRNVLLEIPVQIGDIVQREEICDPPPTYWEAMGEEIKDNSSDDEDHNDGKGETSCMCFR